MDCGMCRPDTRRRFAGAARVHHLSMILHHGAHVSTHIVRKATFHLMRWMRWWCTVVVWWSGHRGRILDT